MLHYYKKNLPHVEIRTMIKDISSEALSLLHRKLVHMWKTTCVYILVKNFDIYIYLYAWWAYSPFLRKKWLHVEI